MNDPAEDFKIRLFQPIIPQYRVPLFERLAARYPDRLEICTSAISWDGVRSSQVRGICVDYNHRSFNIGHLVMQKGFTLRGLRPHRDVVVICGEPKNLSMMWIAVKAKIRHIRVVWWGHHKTAGAKGWRVALRLWMMRRLSDSVLFYTKQGIRWYGELGNDTTHVFATENALDLQPMIDAAKVWNDAALAGFVRENGMQGKNIFLICSRLVQKVRLDLIIRALADPVLANDQAMLVVIGEGVMKEEYVKLAEELGVDDRIRWTGALFEQKDVAPWFLSAKAFVYPGAIGLSILHAFSYGLPVITHGNADNQMPEYEAMVNGRTGLLFAEGDHRNLARVMHEILADEVHRKEMSQFAMQHVFSSYTIDKMTDNFCEAINDAQRQGS